MFIPILGRNLTSHAFSKFVAHLGRKISDGITRPTIKLKQDTVWVTLHRRFRALCRREYVFTYLLTVVKVVCIKRGSLKQGSRPKGATAGVGVVGEGCRKAPPHQLGSLGERCKLLQRGPGTALEEVGFGVFWGFKNRHFLSATYYLSFYISCFFLFHYSIIVRFVLLPVMAK